MTTPNMRPIPSTRHPKTDGETTRDRTTVKKAGLLWWAQFIFELAKTASRANNYPAVLSALEDAVADLNPARLNLDPAPSNGNPEEVMLLSWSQALYQSALVKCYAAQADANTPEGNFAYQDQLILQRLKPLALRLIALGDQKPRVLRRRLYDQAGNAATSTNCNDDDDCPDDYICVEGTCESVFPMD